MLKLLQALFYNRDFNWNDIKIFRRILEDKQFDYVAPQIYSLLKKRGLLNRVPSFFQQAVTDAAYKTLYSNMLLKADMRALLNCFEARSIGVIPFKGTLFSEQYYGDLSARYSRDLDILVRPEQMKTAVSIVKALGYLHEQQEEPEHFHRVFYKHDLKTNRKSIIELHWHFLRSGTSSLHMGMIWNASLPLANYRYIHTLSDFHMFYVICLHAWNHELNGWKHFIDIAQMICALQHSLSYSDLLVFAKQQKTYRRIVRTLTIVYHEFPGLNEILPLPFYEKKTFWWSTNELGRKIGPKETLPTLIKRLQQLRDYDDIKQKIIFLKREVLPDPVIMNQVIGSRSTRKPRIVQYFYLYLKRLEYLFIRGNNK
ncbi:nucleotidyltransferase family protein [Sporolactobacillus shoreicorticis]|uniref:Nucleotidyltransferase family protein n=1 Tax=Sporolactobacillus shoreicorticis TaxID=1923877 RepID=A0ABW5S5F1_9BACL|nr:nucleotidyltransferase family protein [Sporolactobacillus shoreicorticis]MCO7124227.1 nucleotidyltransferase family protein [Sporolactobacillus shoreicorticis]